MTNYTYTHGCVHIFTPSDKIHYMIGMTDRETNKTLLGKNLCWKAGFSDGANTMVLGKKRVELQVGVSVAAHITTASSIHVESIDCSVAKESAAQGNLTYDL